MLGGVDGKPYLRREMMEGKLYGGVGRESLAYCLAREQIYVGGGCDIGRLLRLLTDGCLPDH